jgi:hypothetical protein
MGVSPMSPTGVLPVLPPFFDGAGLLDCVYNFHGALKRGRPACETAGEPA